ncbi:MAG: ABC transporter ATP-binding protein [Acidobacteriota bacterium]
MIEVKDLRKEFGSVTALTGISFRLSRGEVVGLLGHNGAGKTTTLRLLLKLIEPTTGSILCTEPGFERNHRVGFLPDSPFFFENLTGREMLDYLGCLQDIAPGVLTAETQSCIEAFGLQARLDSLVRTYSKGMKKKLAIVASLIADPLYWFLDEPTESLDPMAINALGRIIRQMRRTRGILISSHQLDWIEKIVDRVLILNRGEFVFRGTVESLHEFTDGESSSLEDIYIRLHDERRAGASLRTMGNSRVI